MRRLGKDWTSTDIEVMRDLAKNEHSARHAAKVLGRSRGAVAFKAMSIGLSFRSLGRKHSRSQKARYSKGK